VLVERRVGVGACRVGVGAYRVGVGAQSCLDVGSWNVGVLGC
jgi:hypothetical protein